MPVHQVVLTIKHVYEFETETPQEAIDQAEDGNDGAENCLRHTWFTVESTAKQVRP